MTLPAVTWRMSASYSISIAGTTATTLEIMTAIKAAFDAEDVIGSNLWTVSHSSLLTTSNTLEFKRKGSPSAPLGEFRALLMAGTTAPNAAAIQPTAANAANYFYISSAANRTTDAPDATYTSAAPYDITTYLYNKGCFWAVNSIITSATSPKITIMEHDKGCCIVLHTNTTVAYCYFGEIFEKLADNSALYGVYGSLGGYNLATISASTTSVSAEQFPITDGSSTLNPCGAYRRPSDSQQRIVGRYGGAITNSTSNSYVCENTTDTFVVLFPVLLADREGVAATRVIEVFGVLRQMRPGPQLLGRRAIYDGGATLRGYAVNGYVGTSGNSLVFDNTP